MMKACCKLCVCVDGSSLRNSWVWRLCGGVLAGERAVRLALLVKLLWSESRAPVVWDLAGLLRQGEEKSTVRCGGRCNGRCFDDVDWVYG